MTKTVEPLINTAYSQTIEESTPSFPCLMASDYRPKISDKVSIGLPIKSWEMLTEHSRVLLGATESTSTFGDETLQFFSVSKDVRWVILSLPKLFVVDADNNIEHLSRGQKLAGTGKKTIAKLFLCAIVGDDILSDESGAPQVFTLNLKSTKTSLIGKATDKAGAGTIWALNNVLRAHWSAGKGTWLTSQVSVQLGVKTEKFSSSSTGASSVGVMFTLGEGAKVLSEDNQAKIYHFLQDQSIRDAMSNPFNLEVQKPVLEELTITDESGSELPF